MHIEMQVCAMRRYNVTNPSLQTDLVHGIYMLFWSFWNAGVNSVEVFLYNSYTIAFPNTPESNDCMYCFVCSL